MLHAIDPDWPTGIEKRWVSEGLWPKLDRIYLNGLLKSDPHKDHHVCATLGYCGSLANIKAIPWSKVQTEQGCMAILAYDVIDHLPEKEDINLFLSQCFQALDEQGRMYMMCHPYKSRVGTHLFHQNKAYLHIIKNNKGIHTLKIDDPVAHYRKVIKKSGFLIESEQIYTEFIESYFDKYDLGEDHTVQFVEYIMRKT